jgi:hypothetical protein
MSEEIEILKEVCHKLEQAGISYMLTGSLAANLYATPRMTRDIDFVVEVHNFQVNKFFQIFSNDFYITKEAISAAVMHEGMFNAIHNKSIFKIDFIVRKDTAYRETEFQRRRKVELDGETIWVVSPEDLILSKLFWAKDSFSEMQIRDVKNLFHSIKKLDEKYIANWIQNLNLTDIYSRVKNE